MTLVSFELSQDVEDELEVNMGGTPNTVHPGDLLKSRRWLYLSHFFAHVSDTLWQFAATIFLSACANYQSLIFVSTFGLSINIGTCFAVPALGKWIDNGLLGNRLQVARILIAGKHFAVLLAVLLSWVLIILFSSQSDGAYSSSITPSPSPLQSSLSKNTNMTPATVVALIGIHIVGMAAAVLNQTYNVVMERDWVVVLGECSDNMDVPQHRWLSNTNATMKGITLLAPGVVSILVIENNLQLVCLLVGILHVAAWTIEKCSVTKMYEGVDALKQRQASTSEVKERDITPDIETIDFDSLASLASTKKLEEKWGLVVYLDQPAAWSGLGLALLYANSLTFGNGILTAYLLYHGTAIELVGAFRGISSAIGLLGTIAYTYSIRFCSLEATGLLGLALQTFCMTLAVVALSLSNDEEDDVNGATLPLLISSICASRLGMWVGDISITQIQQQETPEDIRCVVGGVQEALNAFFLMISFGLGILFRDPKDFIYLSISGLISVALALAFLGFGIYLPRSISRRRAGKRMPWLKANHLPDYSTIGIAGNSFCVTS